MWGDEGKEKKNKQVVWGNQDSRMTGVMMVVLFFLAIIAIVVSVGS